MEEVGNGLARRIADNTSRREICRYLGYRGNEPDPAAKALTEDCIGELAARLSPRFFAREYPYSVTEEGELDLTCFRVRSESLGKNLRGCRSVILFGATLGAGVDLLLRRYSALQMSRAVVMQAAAAAMIESYCNLENDRLSGEYRKKGLYLRPRFSPGYGDFPLEAQKEFAKALELEKRTGIALTDSLLMVPSKSVTAVIGVSGEECRFGEAAGRGGCGTCEKTDCMYRE